MAVEGIESSRRGNGTAFLVSAGVMYEIIAAACSSPQTAELNAKARSKTLMKWVNLGMIQGVFFVIMAALYEPKRAFAYLSGGGIAAGMLYWQYDYALKSGLKSDVPPTENYNNPGNDPGKTVGNVRQFTRSR
jgi:hypothetical protein